MVVWQEEETIKLLDLWSEESVQALLKGCTRNKIVYDKLAEDMAMYGYTRTGGQCWERIKKLKKDCKKTKDNLQQTGNGNRRKQCKFFEKLNEILGEDLLSSLQSLLTRARVVQVWTQPSISQLFPLPTGC